MTHVNPAHVVGTGGALGAILRYWIGRYFDAAVPIGTCIVNVSGSFVLALLAFASASPAGLLFFGVGMCGSFTTFSTFSYDTVRLWETGKRGVAVLYSGGTLVLAGGAVGLAWIIVHGG